LTVKIEKNKSRINLNTFKVLLVKYGIFLVLIAMLIIASLLSPYFLTRENLVNVVRQVSIMLIVASGMTMLLVSGLFDISAGSVMAFAGILAVDISMKTNSPIIGILAAIAVGAAIGFINGGIIAKYRVPAFIVTLGMMSAARGAAYIYTGGYTIVKIGSFKIIGQGSVIGIPLPIIIMAFILVIAWVILNRLRFGRYLYAIGGNEQAALASGVNIVRIKILVFVISGCLIGLAGAVLMGRINAGVPTAGEGYEFDAITAAIIGGTSLYGGIGNIPGTIVGALIIGVLNNILNLMGVSSYWQLVVKGAIIVGAVLLDIKTKQTRIGK